MDTKKLYLLLGLSIALFSCSTQQKTETAVITVKVDMHWSHKMKLSSGPVTLTDSWIDRLAIGDSIINLDEDGTFKIKLPIDKPNFYSLSHESNEVQLFLSPNDSMNIDFKAETVFSGRGKEQNTIKIYKRIGNMELEAHIFYPEDFKESDQRPAYLFFHGGGWSLGIPEWGYKNCKRYSSKGMVAISFEYRLIDIHESNLLDCARNDRSILSKIRVYIKMITLMG